MKTTHELRTKQKIKLFEEAMKGDHALIHLDSRRDDVVVPEHLRNNHALTLKLSYLFQGKTEHNEENIVTQLKFSGDYFECIIPWKAVWGITPSIGTHQVWPEDMPKELIVEITKAKFKEVSGKLFKKEDAATKQAEEQKQTGTSAQAPLPSPPDPNSPEQRRKQLKRIK